MAKLTNMQLHAAIDICVENHSTNLTINHLCDTNFVPSAYTLVIHECVPAVINKLKDAGFRLGMNSHGMYVDR